MPMSAPQLKTSSRSALLIDDNDDYAAMLLEHLAPRGFRFDRARSAREGMEILRHCGAPNYRLIVTDITMEGQTAGLKLIFRLRRLGFRGVLVVASTGFNLPWVLHVSRPLLALLGVDALVPKEPLKQGRFDCRAISAAGRAFMQADMR